MKPDRTGLAAEARELMGRTRKASLGTLAEREGVLHPFVSLAQAAPAPNGFVLLLSDLSDHARHLQARPLASLMIDGTGKMSQPLAGPRLTVLGEVTRSLDEAGDRALYLERFPDAALYADFGDFHVYRMTLREGYFVAGFGRVQRLEAQDLLPPAE